MAILPARVLNVDDNPAGLYAKSRILRFSGYEVFEAVTGQAALESVREHRPDVVLLDVNLPDLSGYEVCRKIKSDDRSIACAVIMTSAVFTRGTDRARGIEGGADGYLVAPIEPEIVNATIQSILRVRKAEIELRESAAQWKTTFRSITDGIALLDSEGSVLRCNRACEVLLGSEESAMTGKRIDDILSELVAKSGFSMMAMLASDQSISTEAALRDRILSITFDPVFEEGRRSGAVCILSDVTAERTAQHDLREAKEAAEEANQAKDRFLATLSHELRTPLTPVVLLLEELRMESGIAPDLKGILDMMYRNITLEARLIDDLLDLSRISKGKLSLNLVEVHMHELVRFATDIVEGELAVKHIRYSTQLNAERDLVSGDPGRLQQILWNLLKNALKFTPPDGEIDITTSNPDDHTIAIAICDSGIGIEQEALERIFNAFEQAEKTIPQRFGGLGLGLAISKNLAKMHNGDLIAHSEGMNKGTTITLTLPLL